MSDDEQTPTLTIPQPPRPDDATVGLQLMALQDLVREQASRIERLEAAVEQAIDLLLLPEADRLAFAAHKRYEQFQHLKREVENRIAAGNYADLSAFETKLRQNFKDEPEAHQLLQSINDSRHRAVAEAIETLSREVESLMSMARWNEAFTQIDLMSQRFPGDVSLINLAARVHREQQGWRESVTTHLYDQVKMAVDRRDWKAALRHGEELATRFADHPRGHKVAQQLATLRENAEIAARQDLEQQLHQLVRSRRYDEAIVLGEQIIRDYPHSPQAAECKAIIPRLEQLALQHETDESTL